jgi:hypothetical protein
MGCDDPHMIEYGNTVEQGSGAAGGAGGNGGAGINGGPDDMGAAAVNFVNDSVDKISALPPEMLVLLAVVVLAGLIFLKRAF